MKIRNMVISFAIFYAVIVLSLNGFTAIKTGYNVTEQDNDAQGRNVFEALKSIPLITGMNKLQNGIYSLTTISNAFDVLGGLAASATGILQVIGGIVLLPVSIFGILSGFYGGVIPPVITEVIGFIVVVAVAFILISAKLGFEL